MSEKMPQNISELILLQQSNPCRNQTVAGGEPACCKLKWTAVINDPQFAGRVYTREDSFAPTVCVPGTMGRHCYGEDD